MRNKIGVLSGIIVALFILLWYLGSKVTHGIYQDAFILLCGVGIILTLYVLDRITIFKKKLQLALTHILENNFRTGISIRGNDECSALARRFNAVTERINEYDRLRETRVDSLNRLTSALNRNIQDGIMILDLDTSRIKINKAAQEIFGIGQDDLSIDSVVKLATNSVFNKLYEDIINRRANTIAEELELFLPVLKAKARINLKMFAIKDKDEKLKSILCIFSKA